MVKICLENNYPKSSELKYSDYFNKYSYSLSGFQKHAIEGIVEGHHSLSCVPTGSGKTLAAEFAIEYIISKGKRVIYTSPLKALSNEKYYSFTQKFPEITIGIITGDVKANPDAQVLVMTAEILLNTLYNKKHKSNEETSGIKMNSLLAFDMNFDNELACVIMDEIHFINDESRGGVWEQTIMMLPPHIQLIMLSATLDKPEKFAQWIESRKYPQATEEKKEVYLATSSNRLVPLTHYSFITTTQGIFKQIKKDEILTKEIKDMTNKLFVIQSSKGEFNEPHYYKVKKTLALFEQKNVYVKRQHVINEVLRHMVENDMLPAVLFILSRKQIDIVSKEITAVLLEDDSKIPYIVRRESEQIIRKLPNYQEYLELPEYNQMVSLLEKGIAIHHSGVLPVLREIVEMLFAKGYIKLLLATETFSTGLNMPIKTTIFTSLSKYDGRDNRFFYSHEYTQMAGRAGRRGIDSVGHVIHLNNLFKKLDLQDYKMIMHNKPQTLVSKFKISYNLLLNLIDIGDQNLTDFVKKSMINDDINSHLSLLTTAMKEKEKEVEKMDEVISNLKTPREDVQKYITASSAIKTAVNKKRKELDKEIQRFQDTYRTIDQDKAIVVKYNEKIEELSKIQEECNKTSKYLNTNVLAVLDFLQKE
jgi:antiviral helicase SKI2